MAGDRTKFLCCTFLAATGGLHLCWGIVLLEGLKGRSLSFPTPYPNSVDIARVTWRSQRTHIAEAKPREMKFTVDHLPRFHGRLLIHLTNLSLEIRPLKLEDSGRYEVVVDTLSDPTNTKTFSYIVKVYDTSTDDGTEDPSGTVESDPVSTVGPWRVTEPHTGDTNRQSAGGGGGRETERCEVQDHHCQVKGYLMVAVFGPLLMLVATIHIVTRDKATKPRDEVSPGPRVGSETFGIMTPQEASQWQQ